MFRLQNNKLSQSWMIKINFKHTYLLNVLKKAFVVNTTSTVPIT